jgi:hypothetical protein
VQVLTSLFQFGLRLVPVGVALLCSITALAQSREDISSGDEHLAWDAEIASDQFEADAPFYSELRLLDKDADGSPFHFAQARVRDRRGRPSPIVAQRQPLPNRRPVEPRITAALLASVPDMFGDFFGGGRPNAGPPGGNHGGPPRGGAATRTIKLSENYSAQPRDRYYVSYHFFNDVLDGSFGDVNRYTVGFETTLGNEFSSIEVRLPIAHTLASDQIDDPFRKKDVEVGNLTLIGKRVIYTSENSLVSVGTGLALPTADDNRLFRPGDHLQILDIENKAVHLLPFIGGLYVPNEDYFFQGFAQLDLDLNGNPVRGDLMAMNLKPLGVVQDSALLFLDFSVGKWLYREPDSELVTGVASVLELHYTTSLQDADVLDAAGFLVGDSVKRFNILDLTFGSSIQLANGLSLRPGVVVPIRRGSDQQFDYEVFLQLNAYR